MKSSYWNVMSNRAWIFLMLLGVVAPLTTARANKLARGFFVVTRQPL